MMRTCTPPAADGAGGGAHNCRLAGHLYALRWRIESGILSPWTTMEKLETHHHATHGTSGGAHSCKGGGGGMPTGP